MALPGTSPERRPPDAGTVPPPILHATRRKMKDLGRSFSAIRAGLAKKPWNFKHLGPETPRNRKMRNAG